MEFSLMSSAEQDEFARGYCTGNCDVMALALHRLTGLPFGLWAGRFVEDGEECIEFCHAVVVLDEKSETYLDVHGVHSGRPNGLYFSSPVTSVFLMQVRENDVRSAFSCEDIDEESIEIAMEFAKIYSPVATYLKDNHSNGLGVEDPVHGYAVSMSV